MSAPEIKDDRPDAELGSHLAEPGPGPVRKETAGDGTRLVRPTSQDEPDDRLREDGDGIRYETPERRRRRLRNLEEEEQRQQSGGAMGVVSAFE
ncbi:uncharacterized protein CTRU02_205634 [Colletotrichum truncatum]|uniref:Uncharacterized protein n=1 Tax=Colletotrichum truncatum TaxID=5467 RepID=A0ACC3Z4M6_COLTU|nr:uncharacterized protein CTRU02_09388 [Colletotrichum truncatum]KAF6788579.1 hypothetical protein CTRU02_09388 [Colletotrichum truncatum]